MNIHIITASAGSGKTTRLSEVLDDAIASHQVRPEAIVATTFTKEAAAELVERARARLLASGRGREAPRLLAARIGTVNAVCGGLVEEFAFELGLSPALRVLDEDAAELEQKRALAGVVDPALADELSRFKDRFEQLLDWSQDVRKIIENARANGIAPDGLAACAARSIAALDAGLGPGEAEGEAIDRALEEALDRALAAIDTRVDATKKTGEYLDSLRRARRDVRRLRWGEWAKLSEVDKVAKKSQDRALPVARAAARHVAHPRLRRELARYIDLVFDVARRGLDAYQRHKRERGVIDFVDQEALALELLRRDDVRAALAGQLDLVLVDEFQDTSPLQLAIFSELARLAPRSVWVGDQKQAIFGFRGTDPALMDAVIESLEGTSNDPELVRAAVDAVRRASALETLSRSYRSRPELVALTSDVFAPTFEVDGIPAARTRLEPALVDEPAGLGAIVEHWPLPRGTKLESAAALAAGVRELLGRAPPVRDRQSGAARPARRDDVAVLCRTNEQCQAVAEALAELDVRAVLPRMRLLDTVEGRVVLAGLRLWLDPRDALAAAELARLCTHAEDLDGFVRQAIAAPGGAAFAGDPLVVAILEARRARPDLAPAEVVAAILDAAGLRGLCAAWGNGAQRLANLDAIHALAVAYVRECEASRAAPTLVGLLEHAAALTRSWGFAAARGDRQAILDGDEAVTVSTWHRAKGREWPIVVLFGLETLREATPYGLQVVSDVDELDLAAPLAGRWLRYWPNPYTTFNQGGPARTALEGTRAFRDVVDRGEREARRLVYVGWTRARDRLLFAAESGKLLNGLLGKLPPGLLVEPAPGARRVTWAGRAVTIESHPAAPAAGVASGDGPGEAIVAAGPRAHAAARLRPSAAAPLPCVVSAPVVLGPRLAVGAGVDLERAGSAVHAFLAVGGGDAGAAAALLRAHGLDGQLDPADLGAAAARLWSWIAARFAPERVHREWPVTARQGGGTRVAGAADLVLRTAAGYVVIDHKTFPGTLEAALARVAAYSGQLAAYAHAIATATGVPVVGTWIHLPVLGVAVELCAAPRAG